MRRISLLIAFAITIAACGGGDSTQQTAATDTTASPPTTSTPATTTTVEPAPTTPNTTSPPTTTAPSTTVTTIDPVISIVVTIDAGQTVVVVNGTPVDGRVEVDLGSQLRIEVLADIVDEVHLHGYDIAADLIPGEGVVIELSADIPGIFEVELENAHRELFELQVS